MIDKTFWILGGACTGKTTLATALCDLTGHQLIDMDARIYGTWMPMYSAEKYPGNHAWIQQSNALEWALQQTDEAYIHHCEKTSREYYQLLAIELESQDRRRTTIVDGGFSSLVPWIGDIQQSNAICLDVSRDLAVSEWNSHPDRVSFKHEILALPNGEKKWQRFLELDALITCQLVDQAQTLGLPVIYARRADRLGSVVEQLIELWALTKRPRAS
ncbi:MAG: hypothetical protein E4G99_13565 [Anaerolineales bacterium]|nr:MAG: hypothetical protein E4G99_13565 [Anaerolineales bacterium]